VLLGIGDDLAIARMIGRLDGDDPLADCGMLLAQVFGQLGLGAGRPDNQDLAGIAECTCNVLEEMRVRAGVPAADCVGLVTQMTRWQMRMQRNFIIAGQADMEKLGLMMVEPDDGVVMG
jgi:hypothetical protein